MESTLGIRLLDAEPGIGQFLSEEDRASARRLIVPTEVIAKGELDICEMLAEADSFAAIVLEGMLLQRLRVGDYVGLRLVGPGDLLSLTKESRSIVMSYADCKVTARTRVALLGGEVLAGAQRWPRLMAGLHVRAAEQNDRLAAQLVICQLPRVDQRLMAMMWLLAESWGHVTAAGTTLPLHLTHDVLGGLIGARRSTVTLALGELAERGALIRQDRVWLLLEPPPSASLPLPEIEEPQLIPQTVSSWTREGREEEQIRPDRQHLLDTVRRLREEHVRYREELRTRFERVRQTRARQAATRATVRSLGVFDGLHHQVGH